MYSDRRINTEMIPNSSIFAQKNTKKIIFILNYSFFLPEWILQVARLAYLNFCLYQKAYNLVQDVKKLIKNPIY